MRSFVLAVFLAVLLQAGSAAAGVMVTTGAGYKAMVEELCRAYRESGGLVEEMYGGHIGAVLTQITQGSGVNVVISDRGTLEAAKGGVLFDNETALGDTPLVLAWRKGVTVERPEDLAGPGIESVCHPDAKAAIYGRAAAAYLESSGLGAKISQKLSVVSSVPQVFSYLAAGEMDAGFVNRAIIVGGGDRIGGYMEISSGYPRLEMVAVSVAPHGGDPETALFLEFLGGDRARAILRKYGIW